MSGRKIRAVETLSNFIYNLFLLVFMVNMICNGICSKD